MTDSSTRHAWQVNPGATFEDVSQWCGWQVRHRPLKNLSGHVQDTIGALPRQVVPNWRRNSCANQRCDLAVVLLWRVSSRIGRLWHGLLEERDQLCGLEVGHQATHHISVLPQDSRIPFALLHIERPLARTDRVGGGERQARLGQDKEGQRMRAGGIRQFRHAPVEKIVHPHPLKPIGLRRQVRHRYGKLDAAAKPGLDRLRLARHRV